MQCTNCSNKITSPVLCKVCSSNFCSNSCIMKHFSINHTHNINISPPPKLFSTLKYKSIEKLTTKCPHIKPGIYLSTIAYDAQYSMDQLSPITYNNIPFLLGSGSFGDVFLAEHKTSQVQVAIKKMNKRRIISGLGSLDVILNEINIHSRLQHEHIVKLLNVYENDADINMILEYANKGNLYTLMQKTRGMTEEVAFKYFIQASSAIHFLHEHNFIHRDIKPENLLLDDNNNLKLADFGWCNIIQNRKRSTFCGTVEYMAPEIVNNENYDASVDAWSLGVLLYEMIHGYSPFRGRDMNQVMINIKAHRLIMYKSMSKECDDLLRKLLSFYPENRLKVKDIFTHPFVQKYTPKESKERTIPMNNSTSCILERTLPCKIRGERIESSDTKKESKTNIKPSRTNALDLLRQQIQDEKSKQAIKGKNLLQEFNKEAKTNTTQYTFDTLLMESNSTICSERKDSQMLKEKNKSKENVKVEKKKSSSQSRARICIEDFLSVTASPEKKTKKIIKKITMIPHKKGKGIPFPKKALLEKDKENTSFSSNNYSIVNSNSKVKGGNTSNNNSGIKDKASKNNCEIQQKDTFPDPSKFKNFLTTLLGIQ